METTSTGSSPVKVFTNVDLNINNIDGDNIDTDTGFTFTVGADAVYLFTDVIGASVGLDYNMLKNDITGGGEVEVTYLDVPINFVYVIEAMEGLGIALMVGPYVGIPIGDFEASGGGASVDIDAKFAFGANLEAHTTWEITEQFAIGAHLGFKYAFTDLTDETAAQKLVVGDNDTKYWALGLGVSAKFL